MLKRSGALLLLVLYLITGIGFAITLHYCGNLVTSVKIGASFSSCKKQGMMPGMKCCKNKRIDIKIKDSHQGESQSFLSKLFGFRLSAVNYIPTFLLPQSIWTGRSYYRGPPDRLAFVTPVFIKNRNFRI
jgi:hypothetical protein